MYYLELSLSDLKVAVYYFTIAKAMHESLRFVELFNLILIH